MKHVSFLRHLGLRFQRFTYFSNIKSIFAQILKNSYPPYRPTGLEGKSLTSFWMWKEVLKLYIYFYHFMEDVSACVNIYDVYKCSMQIRYRRPML